MKSSGTAIKVGITAILVALIAYFTFKFVAKGITGESGYEVFALFRDATGLVEKSRVQIAGLNVGELKGRELKGNQAKITVKIKPTVEVWSNASIYKKSASLLGEFYLEIDPGTPETPSPILGGAPEKHWRLVDCGQKEKPQPTVEQLKGRECNQIANVIEAVTISDILVQVNDTLPVLRDILSNVRKLTEGPLQEMVKEVQQDISRNADAVAKLLAHIDDILGDVRGITHGQVNDDMRKTVANVRDITQQVKDLIGSPDGQVNSNGEKIKKNLDKLTDSLDKANKSLDKIAMITNDVSEVTSRVNKGEGTVGRLLKDDAIAENILDVTTDAGNFIRSLTKLQTIVSIREEANFFFHDPSQTNFKTYISIKLMPKPDKYFLLEFVDDPRGSRTYNHQVQVISGPNGTNPTTVNTDTWTRTPSFKISFMFAKRFEPWGKFGLTGRIGIKESSGGFGGDVDFWNQRFVLSVDLFDFASAQLPRLKLMAAVNFFKYLWLVAGFDDLLNGPTDGSGRNGLSPGRTTDISCGPATPATWCQGGRTFFFGAMLTFNDEDLRALLAIGSSALTGLGR